MARAILIGGGSSFSAAFIRGWLAGGNELAEIWTQNPAVFERSQRTATRWAPNWSVRRLAAKHGIAVYFNPPLKPWGDAAVERARSLGADVLVTCMTMQIVPASLIEHFAGRAVNFHPARLPEHRGPSPFMGILLDGVERTHSVMTLHELSPGIDEGAIIAQRPVPFDAVKRRYERWQVSHAEAIEAMARAELPAFLEGALPSVKQSGGSYRRVTDEVLLGPRLTLAQAERAIVRAGTSGRVHALTPRGARAVKAPLRRLGAATGAPVRLGALSVELDLADARVRVARWTQIDSGLAKFDMIRAMREADRPRQE